MSYIDDLIATVDDPRLRSSLDAEVARLKDRIPFGLVFERHIPETGVVPGLRARRGSVVAVRDDLERTYIVEQITSRVALLRDTANGTAREVDPGDLLLIVPFGQAIYPTLTPLGAIQRDPSKPFHTAISAENYHALQLFNYLYRGQVDCIYIDPPYNTGTRDWQYNNRYVDANDVWRHSKWLSMLERRLTLAKGLLKPNGVLIVTIDEHEVHHLGMLLEQLFPAHLRTMVTIVINPKGSTRVSGFFARVEEYAFFCVPPQAPMSGLTDALDALGSQDTDLWVGSDQEEDDNNGGGAIEEDGEEELALTDDASAETTAGVPQANTLPPAIRFKGALRSGSQESTRRDRPALFYPIWIKPTTLEVTSVGEPLPLDVAPDFGPDLDGNVPAWPIREDGSLGRWQVHAPTMRAKVATGEVRVGRYDPRRKTYPISYLPDSAKTAGGPETRAGTRRLKTVWRMSRHDAGAHGSDLLKNFLGQGGLFAFPKSLYAVRDVLASVIREKPDALVLDFFAGSGTTLHATCLLNAEDNGRRRCVLVTSNEVDEKQATILQKQGLRRGDIEYEAQGIFERVTRPRCEAALTGRRPDGTPVPGRYANGRPHAEGFMENIEFFRLDYLDKDEVELGRDFEAINPCLWLMSGGRGSRLINGVSQGWSIPEGGTYAVLFNEARFRVFKKALVSARLVERVFLVTDSNEAYAEMVDALGEEWATSMLYRDYLRNFQINTLETQ